MAENNESNNDNSEGSGSLGKTGNTGSSDSSSGGLGSGSSNSTTTDWRQSLTNEAHRTNPTILNVKASSADEALNMLSDQLINAQTLIGGDKVLRPKEDWSEKQLSEWRNDVMGVPINKDGFKLEGLNVPEGVKMSDEYRSGFIDNVALKLSLDDNQTSGILQHLVNEEAANKVQIQQHNSELAQKQLLAMQEKWGDQFDANMQIAEHGLHNLAPEAFIKMIESDPTLSTHEMVIETFFKAGQMMQSDNPSGMNVNNDTTPLGDAAQALNAINELESSADYLKFTQAKVHLEPSEMIAKAAMLERRTGLYAVAYPE